MRLPARARRLRGRALPAAGRGGLGGGGVPEARGLGAAAAAGPGGGVRRGVVAMSFMVDMVEHPHK